MIRQSERKEKFTPGPWRAGVCQILGAERFSVATDINTGKVVSICGDTGAADEEELIANTYFIAAAPDMYAALKKAVNDYGCPGGPWNVPNEAGAWIEMAQSALAKANGES